MNEITHSPVFGVLLSLIAYEIGIYINRKIKLSILNPLLIAIVIVIVLLTKLNINYENFNAGGQFISFYLLYFKKMLCRSSQAFYAVISAE